MAELIPIGRFSRMSRLSVKALRHYDDIGLLLPAKVDTSSGYRYYQLSQANRAEAIRVLRAVDMPLDEIAEILNEPVPANARKRLEGHRSRLVDRLMTQQRTLAYLERLITQEETIMPYEISVKEVPAIHVIAKRLHTSLATIGNDLPAGFGTVASAGHQPVGPPFVVFHDVIDEHTDGDIEICFPVAHSVTMDGEVYGRTLGATNVAATTHIGPYFEVGPAYHAITGWAQDHGHEFAGPPREIYMNDPTTIDESEYVTEVQWPIR